ncbi:LPXTG-motif protein cell wall anchor domain protein [Fructobacillus pseudoficulneus]|uniref:LPXTG-motif protein cell wall anchor domain protein n=1 Tax=Fructobacillus pseudoficulneus TaxID=220714 RepID=A0A3F3HBR1_9LACO|nr:DUF1542 domain-containing protein [Fructobacillus pseudoficulneus]GAP03393.1 LPXTG-motif protein cell wall anchor domain protein [Fructobacillus pseudoficulneus]SEH46209.1 protein of unknown function [Fructobacillus pseudoficulneus]
MKAIQAIPTDGQSIQQRATDMIASLNKEADKVKTDINTDASLSTADRQSQEKAVENAVAAGVQQINQATTVQDGVTATQNAVNAIDAVHQPGSLPTQKTAVTNTGVGYLKDLTAAIVQDATLQNTEGSHLTDMVVQARDNFTASIKNAQDADSVNQALTDLNQAVQQIANQQTKYDDIHQLQQTASTTTTKIQTDNTLSAAMEANQLAAVQQQLTTATNAVNAIAIGDSQASAKLSSALATGNQNIANSYQPGTPVADHQAAWQQAINDEAQRVTNAINADPTLTGEQQRQQVASVQAAQSNLLTQIEAVTSVQAGDTAQANGLQALDQLHVAGQPVATQQQTGQTTAAAAIAAEQKNIDDNAANMQPSDKSRLDQAVQAAQQAATTAISQAQKADDITKAQSDLAAKLAGIDLDLSHSVGQEKLNVANTQATNAIQNDPTLTGDAKQAQLQSLAKAYQSALQALTATTSVTDASQVATTGVQTITAVHQAGEDLSVQKKNLIANIQQADKSLKAKIDADNTLSQAQKIQQKQQIDTNEGTAINGINQAADADSAKKLADSTNSANSQVYVPGTPLDGQNGQRAALQNQITAKSQAVVQANAQNSAANAAQANQQEAARHDGGDAQKTSSQATINQNIIDDGIQLAKQIKSGLPLVTDAHYQLAVDQALSQLILALANAKTQADVDRAYANYEQTLRDILAQANQATKNQSGSTPGVLRLPGQLAAGQTDIIHNNLKTTIILSATAATLSAGLVATTPHFKIFKRKERR